jgi:hypothetical protein
MSSTIVQGDILPNFGSGLTKAKALHLQQSKRNVVDVRMSKAVRRE